MVRNTIMPEICGEFVRWVNREEIVISVNGKEIVGHSNFWTGDIPMHPNELREKLALNEKI